MIEGRKLFRRERKSNHHAISMFGARSSINSPAAFAMEDLPLEMTPPFTYPNNLTITTNSEIYYRCCLSLLQRTCRGELIVLTLTPLSNAI